MSATSLQGPSIAVLERNHFSTSDFRTKYAARVFGQGDRTLAEFPSMNTCALRVSMALRLSGVTLPRVINEWKYAPEGGSPVYLPSRASDYLTQRLLANPVPITGPDDLGKRSGIVLFNGGFTDASGHITVCNDGRFHLGDASWSQAKGIYLWTVQTG